jgi:hypothetical protein
MKLAKYGVIPMLALLGGCVTGFTEVIPGVNTLGSLRVTADANWNKAPSTATPSARSTSRTWTQDGLLLDRITIIPGVKDGEAIFSSRNKSAALPVFRADMLPNEIEELVESSIVKLYGEGQSAVSTSGLRPQGFGSESPDYRGLVGAFIVDDTLYLILFLAADPHYYDKHVESAEAIIRSATLSTKTITNF